MATNIWFRSGDVQTRKTVFEPAYSSVKSKGATCEFFLGGTTTPMVVYADSGANQSLGSEITVDAYARWPTTFLVTGNPYDYTITDFDGTIIDSATNVPNPDVGSGETPPGGAFTTGDTLFRLEDGTKTGFVRLNGRTMGSSSSGATERANDDVQDLYEYAWNNWPDSVAPVIGGRGGSATADFLADKPITLPDGRGAGFLGLDTMGNTAGNFFASTPFTTGDAITVGSIAGYNSKTIAISEFQEHTHEFGTLTAVSAGAHTHGAGSYSATADGAHVHGVTDPGHTHIVSDYRTLGNVNVQSATNSFISAQTLTGFASNSATTSITINSGGTHTHSVVGTSDSDGAHTHSISGATDINGGTDAYNVVQRSILGTFFIKL